MSKWLQVFRNKERKPEHALYACTGCGAIHDASHNDSPPNGLCTCPECKGHLGNSELYRINYELINWDKTGQSPHLENL